MVVGKSGQHPADLCKVNTRTISTADKQGGQRIAVGRHSLSLRQSFTHETSSPQREPAGHPRIGGNGRAHTIHGERGLSEVLTHIEHQLTTRRINKRRYFAIEVGADAVAHVGLHQPFQPIRRLGVRVKLINRLPKRLHRFIGIDAKVGEAILQR